MSYSELIGLVERWPTQSDEDGMSCGGFVQWASSYFVAANVLLATEGGPAPSLYQAGPIMQTTGLAAELALKALLRGAGSSDQELRKYSHNTYAAYCAANTLFHEGKFIFAVMSNTQNLSLPDEIKERFEASGEPDADMRWRCFFSQLRILDDVYDRPYRSRYITPGPIVLPEPYIIQVGVKLLLNAMLERTDGELLPNST